MWFRPSVPHRPAQDHSNTCKCSQFTPISFPLVLKPSPSTHHTHLSENRTKGYISTFVFKICFKWFAFFTKWVFGILSTLPHFLLIMSVCKDSFQGDKEGRQCSRTPCTSSPAKIQQLSSNSLLPPNLKSWSLPSSRALGRRTGQLLWDLAGLQILFFPQ